MRSSTGWWPTVSSPSTRSAQLADACTPTLGRLGSGGEVAGAPVTLTTPIAGTGCAAADAAADAEAVGPPDETTTTRERPTASAPFGSRIAMAAGRFFALRDDESEPALSALSSLDKGRGTATVDAGTGTGVAATRAQWPGVVPSARALGFGFGSGRATAWRRGGSHAASSPEVPSSRPAPSMGRAREVGSPTKVNSLLVAAPRMSPLLPLTWVPWPVDGRVGAATAEVMALVPVLGTPAADATVS